MTTQKTILKKSARIFALHGAEGLSIRKLAHECDIAPSVIYHYYKDKDALLKAMFDFLGTDLGKKRAKLSETEDAAEMMIQRVGFQLDHAEEVVAVLKYYLHYRDNFEKNETGFVPDTAYLHITEVLQKGLDDGVFIDMDVEKEAKVITHAINGFLLEYYPETPTGKERMELVESISDFILRSISIQKPS